jgi:hypothetical protein
MKILGSHVSVLGDTHHDIALKIRCAHSAFNDLKAFFGTKTSTRRQRITLIERSILPILSYACGHWLPTSIELRKIRKLQQDFYSRVVRLHQLHGEDENTFFARRGRFIKNIRESLNFPRWDLVILKRIYSWAGHVVRLQFRDHDRLIVRLLNWQSNLELCTRQALGSDQGHGGGRFYVRRYENNFYRAFDQGGFHWKDIAAFSDCWVACLDSWLLARQHSKSDRFVHVDRAFLHNLRSFGSHQDSV